jgi:2-polyprenyl-3-methyl-5-hydroxy-6-metoxy-1,4-benzoquinol methylase
MLAPAGGRRQKDVRCSAMGYSPLELDPVVLPLIEGRTVLDLGCGFGHWGQILRTHYHSEDRALRAAVTGVDAFEPNVAFCRAGGAYETVVAGDAVEYLAAQRTGAFDTVLATELIEHLSRERGERLLAEAARVAAKVAILSTPNWEYLRPGAQTMTGYNEHEHHVSAWTTADFRRHGYTVRGVGHRGRYWPVRGINRLLDSLPTLDHVLAAIAIEHPLIAHSLVAFRRA